MAEMAVEKRKTHDHYEIRSWIEQHGGHPACEYGVGDGDAVLLQIDFANGTDTKPQHRLDWDEWFETFEQQNLALLYQADMAPGEGAPFYKLVGR